MSDSGIEGAAAAEIETDLAGIAVWDVSKLLPVNRRGGYPERPLEDVTHLFVHHSGRLGAPGFQGLLNSARYVVRQKKLSRGRVGFPGCAYHLWGPYEPCRDAEGRLVVFRANGPEVRCWHTGGLLNLFGESLALQGNTTRRGVSPSQREILEAVLPWRLEALQKIHMIPRPGGPPGNQIEQPTLSWHSEGSRWGGKDKPACPGSAAVAWLTNYRYSSDWQGHRAEAA